jgi:glycosyltransferase involved in cell wall biosynthesis
MSLEEHQSSKTTARLQHLGALAFDATLFDEPVTGIALYARELAMALVKEDVGVELWGAARSGTQARTFGSRSAWTLAELPLRLHKLRPRVFHAVANFNLPLQRVEGVKFVLTVHDVVPLLMPETVSRSFRWQFQIWLTRSLLIADAIICVSEESKRALLERFVVDEKRIAVISHGVDHVLRGQRFDATTNSYLDAQGYSNPFVLYAGALDARKNVELLVQAMQVVQRERPGCTLVLAGQKWFGAPRIENAVRQAVNAGVDIRFTGYLDSTVFYGLMKRAGVFVFPSKYEGFGLPPLEAMALGVPTVVCDGGALPEICGAGARVVSRTDSVGLAQELLTLLASEEARRALAALGSRRAQHFTWAKCAAQTRAVYESVLE